MMEDVIMKLNPELLRQKLNLKKKRALFKSKMYLELRKNLVICYIWSIALYAVETRRRMEKIIGLIM
jgi:hypothetical protein